MGHPEKFGDVAKQRKLSAVNHVAPKRGIALFFILHVADHTDTSAQTHRLWEALDRASIRAQIFGAENSEHVKLDRDIGVEGDAASKALFEFMVSVSATSNR